MAKFDKNKRYKIKNNKLKVVSILDKFTYECLKYEVKLIPLGIKNWRKTLIEEKPDLLLVESAWKGNNGTWRNRVAYSDVKKDTTLKKLVYQCNKLNIPTVFWNKEDPTFFKNFIEIAKLFDYVFTTDEGCIEKYKSILGHNNVYSLPFAAQPKLHNPVDRNKIRLGKVAFAGTWYNRFPKRKEDMEMILKPAFKYGLDIYDRMYNHRKDDDYTFPNDYTPYIRGSLPYEKIVNNYKKYDIFLNANLVTDSLTMFSRRVFELLACGTNIISSYAVGIENMMPKVVKLCKTKEDTEKYLKLLLDNKELRDRLSILGQRKVFDQHTYRHRIESIIEKVGLTYKKRGIRGVSIITCTNRVNKIENVFLNYERQNHKRKELIIILNNNSMNLGKWKKRANGYKNVKVFQIDEQKSLGECMNFAINQTHYRYISKFDDDNYYTKEFLGDLMHAFEYTDADVVGKHTYYYYIEGSNTLAVRFPNLENQYVDFLCGSAFIMKRKIFKKIKFKHTNVDTVTKFFGDCRKRGKKLYSTDRFNYVYIRHSSINKHTWKIEDHEFLKKCDIVMCTKNYVPYITV